MQKGIIVFELNEVPYRVIDAYIERFPQSHLAQLLPRSAAITTHLRDQRQLHPKISWQTFHRGVPDTEHGYFEYNQTSASAFAKRPPLWELLRSTDVRVGVGASIGAYPVPDSDHGIDFYLPDPFAPSDHTIPRHLGIFQQFNTAAVANSSRQVRTGGTRKSVALQLLSHLPKLGITPRTCFKVIQQVLSEKRNPVRIIRRRNIQALMSFDVCMQQIRQHKPAFATVFANHVAASMHRYWAARFPDDYEVNNMPEHWRDTYQHEIDTAMSEADHMLGQLMQFAQRNPQYSIMVLGSMGQAGIEHTVVHNQLVIRDLPAFMSTLGFTRDEYEMVPGMEPEYGLRFASKALCQRFRQAAARIDINGEKPYIKAANDQQITMNIAQNNVDFSHISLASENAEADTQHITLQRAGLFIEPIQDMSGSTAQHVREGCCFVFNGHRDLSPLTQRDQQHDLCAVTASILSALDTPVPDYMPAPVPALVNAMGGTVQKTASQSAPQVLSSASASKRSTLSAEGV